MVGCRGVSGGVPRDASTQRVARPHRVHRRASDVADLRRAPGGAAARLEASAADLRVGDGVALPLSWHQGRQVDVLGHLGGRGAVGDEVAAEPAPQHRLRRPIETRWTSTCSTPESPAPPRQPIRPGGSRWMTWQTARRGSSRAARTPPPCTSSPRTTTAASTSSSCLISIGTTGTARGGWWCAIRPGRARPTSVLSQPRGAGLWMTHRRAGGIRGKMGGTVRRPRHPGRHRNPDQNTWLW